MTRQGQEVVASNEMSPEDSAPLAGDVHGEIETSDVNARGQVDEQLNTAASRSEAAAALAEPDWANRLVTNRQREPVANLHNASIPLQLAPEFAGCLAFDEFASKLSVVRPMPWDEAEQFHHREWTEIDELRATSWMQMRELNVKPFHVSKAALMVARINTFHPVREYLNGLEWDKQNRLDTWLCDYMGAEQSEYLKVVGAGWMISAVARVFRPGCKADVTLIFEGEQGIRKSSAFQVLGGEWFTDSMPTLGTKDSLLQMPGCWIIELAELEPFKKTSVLQMNAFLTCQKDRYRPPFEKFVVDVPRQCVFAGTTNHDDYLRDPTGSRRMWPVTVTKADLEQLTADRDQLWAEAVARYREGHKWWLEGDDQIALAVTEQAARYEGDPWDELIQPFIERRETVTVSEILTDCIGIPPADFKQQDQNRIARALKSAGWKRQKVRVEAGYQWQYARKATVAR